MKNNIQKFNIRIKTEDPMQNNGNKTKLCEINS